MRRRVPISVISSVLFAAQTFGLPTPDQTITLTSAPPWLAEGLLYISRADTNAVGLNNPVLVVEGFDLDNSMNWPELYDLLNQENLVQDIQAFGRDLAILNFGDSTQEIEANSALTQTAIEYINAHRANPTDKFVAVGASLGGLTVRKALVDMPNHQVDAWISFDAPHEGANIPLGIQEYLEFFASQNSSASNLLAILDRPAARQMLLTHHSHPDGLTGGSLPERSDYMALMNSAGYPTNCKSIAISNGSGFGEKQPFSAGEKIIHWTDSGGLLDPSIVADVYALPQAAATVFSGSIRVFFVTVDSTTVNSYHPLSFDNAPGGARSTFLQLYTNIPPDQISSDDYLSQTNHCFIPTVSALGIPIEHSASNLSENANLTNLSPFDEIHYATNNEDHVEINLRNKRWIMRSVLEEYDTDNDGWDDYQEFLVGTDYNSAESLPSIELLLADDPMQLQWAALPNVQYDIWYTPELGLEWNLIGSLDPAQTQGITNGYEFAATNGIGFFTVSAHPVDPVSD